MSIFDQVRKKNGSTTIIVILIRSFLLRYNYNLKFKFYQKLCLLSRIYVRSAQEPAYAWDRIMGKYGLNHRLLQSSQHNSENLSLLLRMTKLLFGKVEQETFTGFDWFLSTIFLISSGNVERCQNILSVLVTMPCIMIIWPRYAEFQSHKTDAFGHLLESLISYEAPLAFNALRMGGVSWWQVCRAWLTECCWRLMSCRDVCGWLTFLVLHSSAEYSLYALAAILLHSHKTLLQRANQLTLWTMITNPPDRLSMNDLLPHIDKLWKRYHSGLLPLLISSTVGSAH